MTSDPYAEVPDRNVVLAHWLDRHNARLLWQVEDNGLRASLYAVNGRTFIVKQNVQLNGGWDIYVPVTKSISVQATLAALADHCEVERLIPGAAPEKPPLRPFSVTHTILRREYCTTTVDAEDAEAAIEAAKKVVEGLSTADYEPGDVVENDVDDRESWYVSPA